MTFFLQCRKDIYLPLLFLINLKESIKDETTNVLIFYDKNNDTHHDQSIQKMIELFKKAELNILSETESINKASLVIFMVKNNYLQSHRFQQDYENSKSISKIMILIEKLNDDYKQEILKLNRFNVIKMYDVNDTQLYGDEFNKLCNFIQAICDKKLVYGIRNATKSCLLSKQIDIFLKSPINSLKLIRSQLHNKCEGILSSEAVVYRSFSLIHYDSVLFWDLNESKIYKTHPFNEILQKRSLKVYEPCLIKHINCLAFNCEYRTDGDTYQLKKNISIVDLTNKQVKNQVEIEEISYLVYNEYNQMFYAMPKYKFLIKIYDKELNLIKTAHLPKKRPSFSSVQNLKMINNSIFVLLTKIVYVYDYDLKLISSFGNGILSSATSIYNNDCSFYILIHENRLECIHVFDSISQSYLGKFCVSSEIMNESVIIQNNLFMYDTSSTNIDYNHIDFDFNSNFFNNLFTCKFDRYNHHSLEQAYLLPCNKYACLKCVCKNYNFKLNKLKCNFCSNEHKSRLLKRNCFMNELLSQNIKEIANEMVKLAKHWFSFLGIYQLLIIILHTILKLTVISILRYEY